MTQNEYQILIEKLPHKGKMRLIDSIVSVDRSSVLTKTWIDTTRTELFGQDLEIESYLGIELIAQAAALPLIYRSEDRKEHQGMIVQVRSFRSYPSQIDPSVALTTSCEVELLLDEKVASVKGRVTNGEAVVCEGLITLAMQIASIDE